VHVLGLLKNLSIVEQQLIARISPCINVHKLKHGGIAANGHCVAFPQEIDKPAKVLPNLPSEINIIKVEKKGQNVNRIFMSYSFFTNTVF
jgi:hypothetical protein